MEVKLSKIISKNKKIFIGLITLALIFSLITSGLFATISNMKKTSGLYFNKHNLADIAVTGTYGISELEQDALKGVPGVKDVEFSYYRDATTTEGNINCRIFSKTNSVSTYELVEGRMPANNTEIAVSESLAKRFVVGSSVEFAESLYENEKPSLANTYFTVVGIVKSAETPSVYSCGTSYIGDITSFAVTTDDAFSLKNFTIARLTFNDVSGLDPYSKNYAETMAAHEKDVNSALDKVRAQALENGKADNQTNVDEITATLDDAVKALEKEENALSARRSNLNGVRGSLNNIDSNLTEQKGDNDITEADLAKMRDEYNTSEDAYIGQLNVHTSNYKGYNDAVAQLNNEQTKLDADRAALENTKSQMLAQYGEDSYDYQTFLNGKYANDTAKFDEKQAKLDETQERLDGVKAKLDAEKEELDATKAQLDKTLKALEAAEEKLTGTVVERNDNRENYNLNDDQYNDDDRIYNVDKNTFDREKLDKDANIEDLERQVKEANDRQNALPDNLYVISNRGSVYNKEVTAETITPVFGSGYEAYARIIKNLVIALAVEAPVLGIAFLVYAFFKLKKVAQRRHIPTGKLIAFAIIATLIGTILGCVIGQVLITRLLFVCFVKRFTYPVIIYFFNYISALICTGVALIAGCAIPVIINK